MTARFVVLAVGCCLVWQSVGGGDSPGAEAAPATKAPNFAQEVRPILAKHCYACHGADLSEGGLRLDLRDRAMKGGDGGLAIKPKDSAASGIIDRMTTKDEDLRMPHDKAALDPKEIDVVRRWIDAGADWPASADVLEGDGTHWSLKPLARPRLPDIPASIAAETRTPVDCFVRATLIEKKMTAAAEADRRTLIRRATFDLTGLPPDVDDIGAYLADESPDAYERVVDRLLASPRLGERWARHWMDVVHFAETHGNDQDRPRPNAWPYRDWLISAFNADMPYDRFIAAQVAGDVLFPDDPQAIVATGMLAAGPWDESSLRDIVDDTLDKKIAQVLDRDDMLSTVMATVTSTTVHCARCHSHKFDPISQQDYYALQAVFAGVDRAERPYDENPEVLRTRRALLAEKKRLDAGPPREEMLAEAAQSAAAEWETKYRGAANRWVALAPTAVASTGGATASVEADQSILFSGASPETDTYTITARTALAGITAIRLEVLADDRLPEKGPGRAINGNLHLCEFGATVAPSATPAAKAPLAFASASADFNQEGWDVARALDGNVATAWGIHPAEGKSHAAVFALKSPIASGDVELVFKLEQLHGRNHTIGRPRISVTTAELPINDVPLPAAVSAIVEKPPAQRSEEERVSLAVHALREKVEQRLAQLPPPKMVYAAASDFTPENSFKPAAVPREVFVLRRGDIRQPIAPAAPGALSCIPGLPGRFELSDAKREGPRRAALARWLVDKKNVLTWRSIANRVWHYHFGRGIVDSPNDLGKMGSPPTHPELLDWLATEFVERDLSRSGPANTDAKCERNEFRFTGAIKHFHRLLMGSAVYRQSSRGDPAFAKLDAGNRYLWRANRQRLDAESIRDAVLAASGKLDVTMGGPSVKQFIQTPGIHVTPVVDYDKFDVDDPGNFRRGVYRFIFRTLPDPFMESMDCPDPSQLAPVRNTSVTPLQALSMLNNRFIVRQSEHFAARLAREAPEVEGQLGRAFELAYGRPAAAEEISELASYAREYGLANACRLIFNSNEFMFVD